MNTPHPATVSIRLVPRPTSAAGEITALDGRFAIRNALGKASLTGAWVYANLYPVQLNLVADGQTRWLAVDFEGVDHVRMVFVERFEELNNPRLFEGAPRFERQSSVAAPSR